MRYRTLLCLAVSLSASDSLAQQRSLKEQLVGTWTLTVNEEEKAVFLHLDASTFPNQIGTDQKRTITSLTADELKYSYPATILVSKFIKYGSEPSSPEGSCVACTRFG